MIFMPVRSRGSVPHVCAAWRPAPGNTRGTDLEYRREWQVERPEPPPVTKSRGCVELKLGHYDKDGIEVVDVEGEIDIYTAPRLRELLIDLVSKNNYQLVVNLEKVGFLDSTGLGVLVGGLKRVRAHDGSLDLVCTREQILKSSDHRANEGLRHPPDSGPGHRGQEGRRKGTIRTLIGVISPPSRPRYRQSAFTEPGDTFLLLAQLRAAWRAWRSQTRSLRP